MITHTPRDNVTVKRYKAQSIHWTTKVIRYDVETGEEITKHEAETKYIKIQTNKHATINGIYGKRELTIGYQRRPQLTIW